MSTPPPLPYRPSALKIIAHGIVIGFLATMFTLIALFALFIAIALFAEDADNEYRVRTTTHFFNYPERYRPLPRHQPWQDQ